MSKKRWIWVPTKPKPSITDAEKERIKNRCDQFIDTKLKPKFIKKFNRDNEGERQIIDIYCKRWQHFFYFIAIIKDDRPKVISPQYENRFARLEYVNSRKFCLAYLRYTGEWFDITRGQGEKLNKCLNLIITMPHFMVY